MSTWLHHDTDFHDNAIAIDPFGCACTDCCVGSAFPVTSSLVGDVAEDIRAGRRVINRTGRAIVLVEEDGEFAVHEPFDAFRQPVDAVTI